MRWKIQVRTSRARDLVVLGLAACAFVASFVGAAQGSEVALVVLASAFAVLLVSGVVAATGVAVQYSRRSILRECPSEVRYVCSGDVARSISTDADDPFHDLRSQRNNQAIQILVYDDALRFQSFSGDGERYATVKFTEVTDLVLSSALIGELRIAANHGVPIQIKVRFPNDLAVNLSQLQPGRDVATN